MDIEQLKNELAPTFASYQGEIVTAYLFGSMAKGEPSPSSDIDIALLTRNAERISGAALKFRLYPDLCRKLKRNDIDLVLLSLSGNLILNDEIVRNGKVIFSADGDAREWYEVSVLHRATDFKFQRHQTLGIIPQSYSESFDILGENQVLETAFAYRFARIAGFRNFLAHDYEKIDQEVICGQIMSSLDDVDVFIRQIRDAVGMAD